MNKCLNATMSTYLSFSTGATIFQNFYVTYTSQIYIYGWLELPYVDYLFIFVFCFCLPVVTDLLIALSEAAGLRRAHSPEKENHIRILLRCRLFRDYRPIVCQCARHMAVLWLLSLPTYSYGMVRQLELGTRTTWMSIRYRGTVTGDQPYYRVHCRHINIPDAGHEGHKLGNDTWKR